MGLYARLLRAPGVPLLLLACFVGALSIGMLGLATLFLVQQAVGSLAEAGTAAGALTAGNAVGVAIQGRLIDRHGQLPVLSLAAISCALSVTLLVTAVPVTRHPLLIGFLAGLAGASIPATLSCTRVLWPFLVSDLELLTAAYALIAAMFTGALVVGPLLVSLLMLVAGPASAVVVSGGLAAAAGLIFVSTPASRRWRSPRDARRPWAPRRSPALRTLLIGALGFGLANGLIYVGVPAVTIAHREAALSGVLFALASTGDLMGGLFYGARSWPLGRPSRLVILQSATAMVTGCLALTADPWSLAPLMLLIGVLTAPGSITMSALLDVAVPRPQLTEAYTLLVGVGLVGSSMGYAAGGSLVQMDGSSTVFAAAALIMAVAAAWTCIRRPILNGEG